MYKIYPKLINGEKPKFGFEKRMAFSSFKIEAVNKWLEKQENENDWEVIDDKDYDAGCCFFKKVNNKN